jgi:hypothetical protein
LKFVFYRELDDRDLSYRSDYYNNQIKHYQGNIYYLGPCVPKRYLHHLDNRGHIDPELSEKWLLFLDRSEEAIRYFGNIISNYILTKINYINEKKNYLMILPGDKVNVTSPFLMLMYYIDSHPLINLKCIDNFEVLDNLGVEGDVESMASKLCLKDDTFAPLAKSISFVMLGGVEEFFTRQQACNDVLSEQGYLGEIINLGLGQLMKPL